MYYAVDFELYTEERQVDENLFTEGKCSIMRD